MKTIKLGKLSRAIAVDSASMDVETRSLELSFSSETPYERYFGFEILSHDAKAVDLSRLNNSAPLLFNHDMDDYVGVIEKAWIKENKGYVQVRFSKNEEAEQVFQDIKDGILKNVSVGYMVHEMKLLKSGDQGQPDEYLVTKWEPYEVSIVTVPADTTVGIGRSVEGEGIEVPVIEDVIEEEIEDEKLIEPENIQPADTDAAQNGEKYMENVEVVKSEAAKAERERIASINALGDKFKMGELARNLVDSGKSIDEARAAFLEKMGIEQKPVTGNEAVIGLSEKEISGYSFVRAINAMMNPGDKKAQEAAAFEREVSMAAAAKGNKEVRGFMVPVDVLRASKRDLVVGTSTAGGHTVSTDLLAGSFIDLLRNKSVLSRAGATFLNGLVGNIAIPRQTGGATAYWVAESGAPTESQQAFDQVAMSPKTLGAFTEFSRKLMLQSSLDVEALVRRDLAAVIALEIDRAGLYGSGASNQPTGLKLITGVNTVDLVGANPTFAEVIAMETAIASDNADVASMKYLVNAAGRGALKSTEKAANTGMFVWEAGNTVNGYGAEVSNQIASGDFWFGNWADLMIGFWSGLDLLVDPYSNSTSGTIRVVAHQDCDVNARHGESFCRANITIP